MMATIILVLLMLAISNHTSAENHINDTDDLLYCYESNATMCTTQNTTIQVCILNKEANQIKCLFLCQKKDNFEIMLTDEQHQQCQCQSVTSFIDCNTTTTDLTTESASATTDLTTESASATTDLTTESASATTDLTTESASATTDLTTESANATTELTTRPVNTSTVAIASSISAIIIVVILSILIVTIAGLVFKYKTRAIRSRYGNAAVEERYVMKEPMAVSVPVDTPLYDTIGENSQTMPNSNHTATVTKPPLPNGIQNKLYFERNISPPSNGTVLPYEEPVNAIRDFHHLSNKEPNTLPSRKQQQKQDKYKYKTAKTIPSDLSPFTALSPTQRENFKPSVSSNTDVAGGTTDLSADYAVIEDDKPIDANADYAVLEDGKPIDANADYAVLEDGKPIDANADYAVLEEDGKPIDANADYAVLEDGKPIDANTDCAVVEDGKPIDTNADYAILEDKGPNDINADYAVLEGHNDVNADNAALEGTTVSNVAYAVFDKQSSIPNSTNTYDCLHHTPTLSLSNKQRHPT